MKPAAHAPAKVESFAPAEAGQRAFLDPATGQLRPMEHDDVIKAAPAVGAGARRTAVVALEPQQRSGEGGGSVIDVPENLHTFTVATKTPDGKTVIEHATGPKAAAAKVKGAKTVAKEVSMTANRRTGLSRLVRACGMSAALLAVPAISQGAATIVIQNGNAAGVGFNDPTPAAPVGGNPGTTLGQQRLIAFQARRQRLGRAVEQHRHRSWCSRRSSRCRATRPRRCSARPGPISVSRDFPGAPFAGTWYHARARQRARRRRPRRRRPTRRTSARASTSTSVRPDCLTGAPFYLGLDNNHGTAVDLVTVLLHEFGHGLGFSTTTNGTTGASI